MSFDQYLQPQQSESSPTDPSYSQNPPMNSFSAPFSSTLQFQIPQFMYNGAPTLAPGGGAEVLPVGMLSNPEMTTSWMANNGFTPRFSSSFLRRTERPYTASDDSRQSQGSHASRKSSPLPFDYDSLPSATSTQSSDLTLRTLASHPSSRGAYGLDSPSILQPPSSLGLPVYSTSGFDILSVLGRVANRPNPKVILGPVDLTCSFAVVDTRRHDHPIVYCSPTFCRLTGYEEHEVIGRNCRFLQAPGGNVERGSQRPHSNDAVAHLRKALVADKECQTSIVNYRKDGSAFINLLTVIPIAGGELGLPHEEHEVVYHVGFQVDLTEQPNAILRRLRDGSYMVNYSNPSSPQSSTRDRRGQSVSLPVMSPTLRTMLSDSAFLNSLPLSTSATPSTPTQASSMSNDKPDTQGKHQLLNTILLEYTPDFIMVVSLKGSFLYVAPSVRSVLGYEADELIGRSITDFCHPKDVVPLTRELKESSSMPSPGEGIHPASVLPRTVDLLFRARRKGEAYVWVECRGRLHVEPGKGRKAILLSARAREMATCSWSQIARGGGLNRPTRNARTIGTSEEGGVELEVTETEREFWGTLSTNGTFLSVSQGAPDVLGWSASELVGANVAQYVTGDDRTPATLQQTLARAYAQTSTASDDEPLTVSCRMRRKDSGHSRVQLVLFAPSEAGTTSGTSGPSIQPCAVMYQIRLAGDPEDGSKPSVLVHDLKSNVFEELESSRETSWNYELQQLKIANQKLMEEIGLLEAQQIQAARRTQAPQQTGYDQEWRETWGRKGSKRRWDDMEAPGSYS
ncbi:hypothetical protein HGRIS_011225 [Hohenbuehelia grisea]|uniref:PAS domain-containing protein n=1 Tax=Hohenbuehelia grisea TaxID=104357 RepID=A0ABR3JWE2_9AGAR